MSTVSIAHENDVELALDSALLFYRSQGTHHIYATQHSARVVDGKPTLLAGVPITLDQLADIADLAARKTSYRGYIHDRVVYLAPNQLAWWVPACTRRVWFNTKDKIGERSGNAAHPPLVFIVDRTSWSVFALRENARPGPTTKLYTAPYYNVWEGGEICVGNVQTPDAINTDSIKPYEDAFFRSRFTHTNNNRLIHRRGGAERLWMDLLDGADFPLDRLIDAKQTLAETIGSSTNED